MKKTLIPLFILPLVTSCSGLPVSRDEALNILTNIEATISSTSETSYTVTTVTTTEEVETTQVNVYSKEKQFFHTYTISTQSTGRVSESWKFRMPYTYADGAKTSEFIFDVTRSITPNNVNDLEKQYVITYESYTDEAWKKYSDDFEDRLSRRFSDAIDHSRSLIQDTTNTIDLKSFNGNSLFLNCKQAVEGSKTQSTEYELEISNNLLYSIKTISGDSKVETTYKYSTGDILYPSFKVSIV